MGRKRIRKCEGKNNGVQKMCGKENGQERALLEYIIIVEGDMGSK